MNDMNQKPRNWYQQIIASDAAVKAIFDHFRNYAICGGIAAAGIAIMRHGSTLPFASFMSKVSGICLLVIAFFLMVINEKNGREKFRDANIPLFWDLVCTVIYGLAVMPLIFYGFAKSLGWEI